MYKSFHKNKIPLLFLFLFVTCNNLNFLGNKQRNSDIKKELIGTLNSIEIVDSYVTQDYLYLPKKQNDYDILWFDTSHPEYLTNDGKITRPSLSQNDTKVTIKAQCSYKGVVVTKVFEFTISAEGGTSEVLDVMGEDLNLVYMEPGKLIGYGVRLTEEFYISEKEVSVSLFNKVMGYGDRGETPIINLNMQNISSFCDKISAITGRNCFIPTEAQLLYSMDSLLINNSTMEWTCDAIGDFPNSNENPYNKAFPGDVMVAIGFEGERTFVSYYDSSMNLSFRLVVTN